MISKAKRYKYEYSIKLRDYLKNSITRQIERIFDNYLVELVSKNSKDTNMQFTFKVGSKGYNFSVSKDQTNIQLYGDTKLEDLVFKRNIVLLPSSRSGLLQTYLLIEAKRLEDEIELVETDLTNEYPLPGNIVDFIHLLLKYSIKEIGEDKELIKRFEEMLGGKIISKGGILYFYDKQYDLEIRIDKASSGIQELTPLYLVIKHSYLKNLMLIIEEPEAHLHPELIINITRVITWLVRRGAYVIITTHSDYLFNMLNILIRLNKVDEAIRSKWGFREDEYLKPDEVSVYLFKYSPELKSSIAEKLTVEKEEIPEDEFTNVIDELTKAHIKIDVYEGR